MTAGYILLTEKEEMWAKMLVEVLRDHEIPCTTLPVYGAGVVMRTGMPERLEVYVPIEHKASAEALLNELFRGTSS